MTLPAVPAAPVQAAIFDIGGVLITNEMPHVWRDILDTLQIEESSFREPWSELGLQLGNGRIEEAEFWQRLMERTGARGTLPPASLFLREYSTRYTVQKDVLDLVAQLKKLGLRLAVLSNTIAAHVAFNHQRGLFDLFDVRVFSNQVGASKPGPSIYRLCLDRLGLADHPEATFFVDDREENVVAATALGIHAFLFTTPAQLLLDVRSLGLRV